VTDGRVEMTRFGRSQDLQSQGTPVLQRTLDGPADYLERWERFQPAATWGNVTLSPDFPSVAQAAAQLYPQAGGQPVDGVISVDPVGLAALLEFTGPVRVPGVPEPLGPENAAEFLLLDQYVNLRNTPERVDALESLARAAFERLTVGSLPGPRQLADVLAPVVRGGHLHAYGVEAAHQDLFERLGLDGALPPVAGDALSVVNNNATGNKIDVFLSRELDYDVRWNPVTGDLAATATVTVHNKAPAGGLPDYVIGSAIPRAELPPGTNRTHLSVYTPWALEGATLDGAPVGLESGRERGRSAYSLFLDVPPGGRRTLTLELRGYLPPGAGYRLDVAAQPLVTPDRLDLAVDVAGDDSLVPSAPLRVDGERAVGTTTLTSETSTYRVELGGRGGR
jgi:hypothetical protein